ncbi:hypothetical protein [Paracraurococcus ruber]|uniref:DUF3102 domain-containing protein n=1 Tax=Paracraurococcus ruber TaxID=77675 RepID=A0ABS1D585_9PROT|nr:hypothetical protein [Paracraurococcus ruber]MBK1662040.1 hypothetical protein [Paracraurococcus ruber]TDG25769.1 hypothetical protein E2C05_25535 [Paracraurococcus ruber]
MSGFVLKPATRRRTEPVSALPEHTEPTRHRILSNTVRNCESPQEFVAEIEKLWGEAQEKFLTIGRYLVQAKNRLRHGEFELMVATQLPFGKNVAYQLRIVALAVEQNRLEERELPRSYSNAFRLAQMSEAVLSRARAGNLVRPDVTRREIAEFVSIITAEAERQEPDDARVAREIRRLRQRVATLEDELAEAKAKLAELEERRIIDGNAEEAA